MLNGYTIRGSIVGSRLDLEEALSFAAEGKVKAMIEMQPLESINEVFQRLKAGDVKGRVVLGIGGQGFRNQRQELESNLGPRAASISESLV